MELAIAHDSDGRSAVVPEHLHHKTQEIMEEISVPELTHVLSINHYGHTRLDFLVTYEVGIMLAKQASYQLSTQARWRREKEGTRTGLTEHFDNYFDLYIEGGISLRNLKTKLTDDEPDVPK